MLIYINRKKNPDDGSPVLSKGKSVKMRSSEEIPHQKKKKKKKNQIHHFVGSSSSTTCYFILRKKLLKWKNFLFLFFLHMEFSCFCFSLSLRRRHIFYPSTYKVKKIPRNFHDDTISSPASPPPVIIKNRWPVPPLYS